MTPTPAAKRTKESRFSEAWAPAPVTLFSGVRVGWRIRMAWVRVKTPRVWRRGWGEKSGMRGLRKTAAQVMSSRRRAPAWAIQPVPSRGESNGQLRGLE